MPTMEYRDVRDSVRKSGIGRWIIGTMLALVLLTVALKLFFSVNNHEVVALTYPNGQVEFFTSPGIYGQWLGHITKSGRCE